MMLPRDTSQAAFDAQTAYYRRLTPSARVELARQMSEDARAITAAGIQHRHPEYSAEQVRHALLRLLLGDDLFHRAWPNAPLLAP